MVTELLYQYISLYEIEYLKSITIKSCSVIGFCYSRYVPIHPKSKHLAYSQNICQTPGADHKGTGKSAEVEITRDIGAICNRGIPPAGCDNTKKAGSPPPHPKRFLHNLHRYVIQQDKGFCMVARVGGKAIAAYIYLLHGKTILFKYGASDDRYYKESTSRGGGIELTPGRG